MLRAKVDLEFNGLPTANLALIRFDTVMCLLIRQRDRLRVLLTIDAPMIRDSNR